MKEILATAMGSQTLVGVDRSKYPVERGNCFSLQTEQGYVKVVNFYAENLEFLLKKGELAWPIKCLQPEGKNWMVVNDCRIPDRFYSTRFCEVCTPLDDLPAPQRLQHLRDIDRGVREEGDGYIRIKVRSESRPLKGTWTVMQDKGETILSNEAVQTLETALLNELAGKN